MLTRFLPFLTNTFPVFAKELLSYFQSRMSWFIFIVYAVLSMAVTFFQSPFISAPEPGLVSFFKLQANIFALIIPALTIKLWTDEKRIGTFELTLSLPIGCTALTLGKFLAVWSLCGLMLLSTCGLWLSAAWLTPIDNLAVFQNYLVCWLLCGALCAVSLSASAFTAHPVSSFVLSLAVCLAVSLLNFAWLFSEAGFSSEILLRAGDSLSFSGHFEALIAGQVSLGSLFYFFSLIVFALWLNIVVICWRNGCRRHLFIFFICLLISFGALNVSAALFGSSAVWDLSADRRFSLSPSTRQWLDQNNDSLFARLYVSPDAKMPANLREYARDVLRLLEQYQLRSHNKLSLHTVEVLPFSPTEAEAEKAGLRGGGDKPWFGLVVSDQNGRFEAIPYFEPGRRAYLEHDISRLLSRLGGYRKPTLGIMSSEIRVIPSADTLDYSTDWPFAAALRKDYNLRHIPSDMSYIPEGTDALVIINPKHLSNIAVYAIDQYLMCGGNIIVFADPLSEVALTQNGAAADRSNLADFLANLGIGYDDRRVAGDNLRSRSIDLGRRREKYPFWINVIPGRDDHPLIAGLKPLALNSSGWFEVSPEASVIFATSRDGGTVDAAFLRHASLAQTIENYNTDDQSRPLAVLLEGKFNSLFAQPLLNTKQYLDGKFPFLSVSLKPGRILLVADSDILNAELWNANRNPGQDSYDFIPFSGNMDFIERAADYISGNRKILNVAPKFSPYRPLPLGSVLRLYAENTFASEKSAVGRELADILTERENMQRQIRNNELLPSLRVTGQLENLERRLRELRRQERLINRETVKDYQLRLGLFMAFNFIMPLAFLAVITAILQYRRGRTARRAERIVDA